MPDGSVQGSGELTYTAGQLKIHFDINCLTVGLDGKTATMSGVVTSVDGSSPVSGSVQPGNGCWFKVVDNGEGNNAAPDQMTLLFSGASALPCGLNFSNALRPIEGGNIQVK